MRNADTIHVSALAAQFELSADGSLPADIQVFPPGRGVKFTLQDYPGQEFEIDVDATTAEKLDADLQALLTRATSGAGSAPFADKNHEDAEATFHPLRYFWDGDDKVKGGVRLVPDWTPFGAALVRAKAFKYFSQNFLFSKARKKVLGLINENVGGLVNRPGFATQAAFAKAATPLTNNHIDTMNTDELNEIITTALKPISEKVDNLVACARANGAFKPARCGATEFEQEVMAAHAKGMPIPEAASRLSCSRPDLYAAYRHAVAFGSKPAA
jgi:hypothetical protein